MTLRRSIRAGEEINLRAQMLDDLSVGATASGISIYIFSPLNGTTDFSYLDADYSGTPTLWTDGIYEYGFTPPNLPASDGTWTDLWMGTINGQTVSGVFSFEVSANGSFDVIPGQLNQNNIVDVTLSAGIAGEDGSELQEDYTFSFLTTIYPKYTNLTKVMIEVGGAIDSLPDDIIYLSILEASLEADALTFNKTYQNTDFYQHARREWTTCRAAAVLATNVRGRFTLKSKTLADLQVTYDNTSLDNLFDRIAACLNRWETQLNSGGYATKTPQFFVKGLNDPDRPQTGRTWDRNDPSYIANHTPASNTKKRQYYSNRWKNSFTNNKNRWK